MPRRTYNIAMVSDFFFPQPGGVESHIYQLATKLVDRGHKVVVITHAYPDRKGIRYLTNGIKVYHVPFAIIYRSATFPTVFSFFPMFRNIMIREQIDIVHGHASLSSLCHEALLHGRSMGLRTVFTDHSLFGFAEAGSILTNKLLKFILSDVDHVICVSHTSKENTVLRAALDPVMVSVIPNAVVILENHPNTRFIIAGSGPKSIDLEQMIEQNVLQDKVEMLGSVRHEQVRDVMVRGHIYLHPSLTEAFGTVLVEAASCGLYVVCTAVGGIPEVLPGHMTVFAKPEEDDLVVATGKAISALRANKVRTEKFHDQVKAMYSWDNIAKRTERVYKGIMGDITEAEFYGYDVGNTAAWNGESHSGVRSFALIDRLKRYYGCGVWAGKLFCLCAVIDYLLFVFCEWFWPRDGIDIAREWPRKIYHSDDDD
ncbi:to N-acetylglucosaminyltransferase SPT14 [Apiospora kogelbergensis]|uniref:to N-acetylglucosaminyltransferase SPT14 n=1 Tax=Apiospora kogelbergensis TaxID=1337665 RepID=UPI00312F07B0